MESDGGILVIHSWTEAQLGLWVARCRGCGSGPMVPAGVEVDDPGLCVAVTCRSCGQAGRVRFETGGFVSQNAGAAAKVDFRPLEEGIEPPGMPINPTDEPSQAIDVADWLTLEAMVSARAAAAAAEAMNMAGRAVVRRWQMLAGACVEEALKFYDEDNDLPPGEAFFGESSRRQYEERPAMFTRQRLLDLRSQHPKADV